MKRVRLNFVIDAMAMASFLFLASTGVLLRYQLPPGSGGLHGRGTGPGEAGQSVLAVWGYTRHEWGSIHYWIACAMMAVLVIHIFLHWKWVFYVVRGRKTDRSGMRLGLGLFGLVMLLLMTIAPWLASTSAQSREQLQQAAEAGIEHEGEPEYGGLADELRGSMTLEEISLASGLSVSQMVAELGLPEDVSPTAHVGQMLRSYGLHMRDLRQIVAEAAEESDLNEADQEAEP